MGFSAACALEHLTWGAWQWRRPQTWKVNDCLPWRPVISHHRSQALGIHARWHMWHVVQWLNAVPWWNKTKRCVSPAEMRNQNGSVLFTHSYSLCRWNSPNYSFMQLSHPPPWWVLHSSFMGIDLKITGKTTSLDESPYCCAIFCHGNGKEMDHTVKKKKFKTCMKCNL